MESYIIFITSLFLGIFSTLIVRKIAINKRIGSIPDKRMIHFGFIPHMGGLAIYIAGFIGILISMIWRDYYIEMFTSKYAAIFVGATLMLITGILDDTNGLNARTKFILQLLAASIVIFSGCRIETIINPFGNPIEMGFLSIPVTYLWLIGITNAINLLDGLDGLAAGVSAIAMGTFAVLAYQQQDWMTYNICIAFMAGIFGFLYFNYHPASIFMGDTGSLFLGFFIAAIAVKGLQRSDGNVSLLVPIIILSVPIGDTVLAFFRRLNKGQHPFSPDKDHLHHRLVFLGLSHRQAVHIIYLFSFLFGFAAYMVATESRLTGGLIFLLVCILAVFSFYRLGYLEYQRIKTYTGEYSVIQVRKELVPLSMRRFWHKLLLIGSDVITLNTSLLFTFWFRYYSGIFSDPPILQMNYYLYSGVWLILTIVFIFFFMINGLYAMRWDVSRFDQIMRVSKVVFFITAILFIITFDPDNIFSMSRLTLIFYLFIVILFVNSGRLILIQIEKKKHILEYSQHNTLLIGANEKSKKLIEEIEGNPHLLYNIVGYVDNKKSDQAKDHHPYLGKYDKLGKIIREYGVEEVIIAITEKSKDDILNIIAAAQNMKVTFKFIPDIYDLISGHKTEEIIGHPLIRLFPEHMKPWEWMIKRLVDIFVAIVALTVLLPVFLLIMILQLFSGIYPFFIIKDRVGKHKRIFGLLKFNVGDKQLKFGRWLERNGFDNLPILLNLLLGSITLVGPMVEKSETVNKIQSKINFYNRRFLVRPGILGWGLHTSGIQDETDYKKRFDKELFYLENMSLRYDLRIVLRSFIQLFLPGK